jgi:hypothetical protein
MPECVVKGLRFVFCPLPEGRCMYRYRDGKCKYKSDYSVEEFCRVMKIRKPSDAELDSIKDKLMEKMK